MSKSKPQLREQVRRGHACTNRHSPLCARRQIGFAAPVQACCSGLSLDLDPPCVRSRPAIPLQNLETLDAAKLTPLSPEVISRQATINIGEPAPLPAAPAVGMHRRPLRPFWIRQLQITLLRALLRQSWDQETPQRVWRLWGPVERAVPQAPHFTLRLLG